jgi:hypothetical protein
MTVAAARASNSAVSTLTPRTQAAVVGSAALGLALAGVGFYSLVTGSFPPLLSIVLTAIGLLGLTLGGAAWHRRRAAWAILAAMWGVVGFCAFFAAPKMVALPQLEQVTIEMELALGRKKAEAKVDDRNLIIRLQNFGACALFALPFGLLCAGLTAGGREFEGRS